MMRTTSKSFVDALAYVVLLIIVLAACAYMPLGYGVWFEDLTAGGDVITGEFPEEWDQSSLQIDAQGLYCDGDVRFWVTVTNIGEDMTGQTTAILWRSESSNSDEGAAVEGSEIVIGPLLAAESVELVALPPGAEGGTVYGHYWFLASQRPGHPDPTTLWSEVILLDETACLATVTPTPTPTETPPEETPTETPAETDPTPTPTEGTPLETLTETPSEETPTETPPDASLPEQPPEVAPDPSPTVELDTGR